MEGGDICQHRARTQKGLLAHQRSAGLGGEHGRPNILYLLAISNRCLICSTVFKTTHETYMRIKESWKHSRCYATRTGFPYEFIEPPERTCPACSVAQEFETFEELERHLFSHLPTPPSGELRVVVRDGDARLAAQYAERADGRGHAAGDGPPRSRGGDRRRGSRGPAAEGRPRQPSPAPPASAQQGTAEARADGRRGDEGHDPGH
eukprot:9499146-Pyramimonas_sp.AAC.1